MIHRVLIKNAQIVNEGKIVKGDVLVEGDRIAEISDSISAKSAETKIIDADDNFLLPGMIDDQVHFREPGLTHKATIETESKAAVAGGITSFIEMPNTVPQATTIDLLEQKFTRAAETSWANYSFMFGGTNDNLEEILKVDKTKVAGLKLFLGSSTGNMLVDDPVVLEEIFSKTDLLISVHCEDEATIKSNLEKFQSEFGDDIPVSYHPVIRSAEACYISSSKAVELAKKTGARLHVFHISTEKETRLFSKKESGRENPVRQRRIMESLTRGSYRCDRYRSCSSYAGRETQYLYRGTFRRAIGTTRPGCPFGNVP